MSPSESQTESGTEVGHRLQDAFHGLQYNAEGQVDSDILENSDEIKGMIYSAVATTLTKTYLNRTTEVGLD